MIYDDNVNLRNLIVEYRRIDIEEIKNLYMNYFVQQNKKAQNSIHMYHFISNSIT